MKPKLIIDTSRARNDKGFDQLLGNRSELAKFAENCDIFLPSMVIDEVIHQKKKFFDMSKQHFISSPLYKRLPREAQLQIDSHLKFNDMELRRDQSICYSTIDLLDKTAAFDEIRKLAISHEAPFEIYSVELGQNKTDNTDKGFKDACIAVTINQYVNSLSTGEKVFVLIRDRRFEEYLDKNDSIVCVSNYKDFSDRYQHAGSKSAKFKNTPHIIPESKQRQEIRRLLTDFRNSPDFLSTHSLIIKLSTAAAATKLTDDDCLDILESTSQNNQISWLLGDDDVRDFVLPIFKEYGQLLNAEQYNTIALGLGLDAKKMVLMPSDIDLDDIDGMVDSWIELQSEIARGR